MASVFCCPFNTDLASCGGVTPATRAWGTIVTSGQKFGAGCVNDGVFNTIDLIWTAQPNLTGDEGAFAIWFKRDPANDYWLDLYIGNQGGGESSSIRCLWSNSGGTLNIYIGMYDNAGNLRVNSSGAGTSEALDTNWHYVELDWKWNDASGNTQAFFDGTQKHSDNGGNSYSRAQAVNRTIRTQYAWGTSDGMYYDDLFIGDARLHTAGFSNPITPNCVCAVPTRLMTLGAPLGFPNALGR